MIIATLVTLGVISVFDAVHYELVMRSFRDAPNNKSMRDHKSPRFKD